MANRYILDKGQLDRAITSLQMAGMEAEAYLLMEICDEQYIGKSFETLYADISDFATYLFQRDVRKCEAFSTQEQAEPANAPETQGFRARQKSKISERHKKILHNNPETDIN